MIICCVRSCKNRPSVDDEFLNYYPLSSLKISENWFEFYCDKHDNIPRNAAFICSAHFSEDCYITKADTNSRLLIESAQPTLLLPDPEDKTKLSTERIETLSDAKKLEVIKAENESLRTRIRNEENNIKRLEKKLCDKKLELCIIKKYLSYNQLDHNSDKKFQEMLLSKVFSKSQIRLLSGKKKTHWTNDDLAVGYTIRQLSNRRAYLYITKKLNIPLPGMSSIQSWMRAGNKMKKVEK